MKKIYNSENIFDKNKLIMEPNSSQKIHRLKIYYLILFHGILILPTKNTSFIEREIYGIWQSFYFINGINGMFFRAYLTSYSFFIFSKQNDFPQK